MAWPGGNVTCGALDVWAHPSQCSASFAGGSGARHRGSGEPRVCATTYNSGCTCRGGRASTTWGSKNELAWRSIAAMPATHCSAHACTKSCKVVMRHRGNRGPWST
eukprot:1159203-Pelagomonas_calceolata.AAC.7